MVVYFLGSGMSQARADDADVSFDDSTVEEIRGRASLALVVSLWAMHKTRPRPRVFRTRRARAGTRSKRAQRFTLLETRNRQHG